MKNFFLIITGVLVVIAVIITNAADNKLSLDLSFDVGNYASDFELMGVDDRMVSLKDYASAKGFVVIFTCNTCPFAKMYEQRIIELHRFSQNKGFQVIAINSNDIKKQPGDSMEKMKERAKSKGYKFPYLRDDTQEVAKAYEATKTPHTFVLSKEDPNKYKIEFIGAIDNNPRDENNVSETYVEDAINAILEGKKPTKTKARAVGCSIKWTDT